MSISGMGLSTVGSLKCNTQHTYNSHTSYNAYKPGGGMQIMWTVVARENDD